VTGQSPVSRKRAGALVASIWAALLVGCQPEVKIVNYKPFMAGLEGVQTQTPAVVEQAPAPAVVEAGSITSEDLVQENPDGTKTLHSRSGLQLMSHIQRTLAENDAKLFAEQVLSEATREEYHDRGLDPKDAFKALKPHEGEIAKLFARMPLGEYSPNVHREIIGRNMFRVRLTGQSAKGLPRWTGFDMILDSGNWRLRWFVR
jgi:hypothetical protein